MIGAGLRRFNVIFPGGYIWPQNQLLIIMMTPTGRLLSVDGLNPGMLRMPF
jgi:hypothetical protein